MLINSLAGMWKLSVLGTLTGRTRSGSLLLLASWEKIALIFVVGLFLTVVVVLLVKETHLSVRTETDVVLLL